MAKKVEKKRTGEVASAFHSNAGRLLVVEEQLKTLYGWILSCGSEMPYGNIIKNTKEEDNPFTLTGKKKLLGVL